jgi:XTP/dITP diphosphohydrolase
LCDKLIFRHPHVFGNVSADTADKVAMNWEEIKLKEKDGNKTVLGGVPSSLPALIKANRIQEKARNVGFDWDEPSQVWNKVKEEISEVEQEIKSGDSNSLEEEFGDVLFSVINAARLYGVNPENALEKTNRKFIFRFNHLEKRAKELGKSLRDMSLKEMDEIWNEAKKLK